MINLSRDEKKATREENCLVWTSTGDRSRTEKSTSCAGDWLWEKYAEHAFFLVILRISGATGRDTNANCSIKISLVYYVQLIGNLCYNVAICEIIYREYIAGISNLGNLYTWNVSIYENLFQFLGNALIDYIQIYRKKTNFLLKKFYE